MAYGRMKGYTGDLYNGMPVFIRAEYEAAHAGETELDRLCDLTGKIRQNIHEARWDAEQLDERFLYNVSDEFRNIRLRKGDSVTALWRPYRNGFVHSITGEYVLNAWKPDYDSRPAWATRFHRTLDPCEQSKCEITDGLTDFALGIVAILSLL